jgi:hypothetical protein
MKNREIVKTAIRNRKGERGAAMVMVLLIAFLLLVASAGLLLEVSLNTANVSDATAEQQAYNAAESGIQAALNVLRGNTIPDPLLDDTTPATDTANLIDFKKAITLATSNDTGDTSAVPRLSRWINYDYTPTGASNPDRVVLSQGTYDPLNGMAYKIEVSDPDNTGTVISYFTTGSINGEGLSKTFGGGGNTATITYVPKTANDLDVSSGASATDVGRFEVTTTGTGATLVENERFWIEVNMTEPYNATRVIRGFIEAGTITASSMGTVRLNFDSPAYVLMGSKFTLDANPLNLNPQDTNFGRTTVTGEITQAEPIRLRVKATGYGPRGSRKELEAIVQKNFFNGMTAPATLTLVGRTSGFIFNPGSSNVTEYSGEDVVSDVLIPPIGTTTQANLLMVQDSVDGEPPHPFNGDVIGTPSNVSSEMPTWLQSPANLDATIQALRNVARSSNRYYTGGNAPSNFGDNANARGITFVDGDATFTGAGGGLLIVTGKLTLHGNFNFNGLIIVTGTNGIRRSGGGKGVLQGNIVVAPYNVSDLDNGFSGPQYELSGGGNSEIVYNSSSLANGLTAVSNFVLGVAEK